MRISTLLAATAALTIATSASAAVTISVYSDGTGPNYDIDYATVLGQTLFTDFEGALPAGASLSGDYSILAAPGVSGVAAAPSGTPAGQKFLTVPNSLPGTATFDLGNGYTDVSFYWGSIDAGEWNKLEVLGVNGTVLKTITGDQLPLPVVADGNQTGVFSNFRVNFSSDDAGGIRGFRYSANRFAFETDTYAVGAAVPEPATWGLMILGFGMIGAAMRRRQKVSVTYA